MYTVEFNLFALVKRLEERTGKRHAWSKMADEAGISRGTLYNIQANDTKAMDKATIGKLMAYFDAQGMPITPGDLYKWEKQDDARDEARC